MIQSLHKHPTFFFFGLTFLLSWCIWVPMALDHYALLPIRLDPDFVLIFRLFGTLGPAVSAMLVSLILGGKPALRMLLSQLKKWRVGWSWIVAAGLVFPALVFIVAGLYMLIPGTSPLPFQTVTVSSVIVTMIVMTISVTGEEIGWRRISRCPTCKSAGLLCKPA